MKDRSPLDGRAVRLSLDDPSISALRQLREKLALNGCVLISFTNETVGVNSTGVTSEIGAVMERLGDAILAAIDDGDFDQVLEG